MKCYEGDLKGLSEMCQSLTRNLNNSKIFKLTMTINSYFSFNAVMKIIEKTKNPTELTLDIVEGDKIYKIFKAIGKNSHIIKLKVKNL